ncbi:hypothetical protein GCM10020358_81310 [Amorphoplanes nipponensis]|uniref:hypothetical protein n=1 Tax=Actinoplanes nipponensis TaxID=135950 RepID=UPI0031EB03DF
MRHGDGGATEACVVTTTTCPDLGVPAGTWRYTVRPDLGEWQVARRSTSDPGDRAGPRRAGDR